MEEILKIWKRFIMKSKIVEFTKKYKSWLKLIFAITLIVIILIKVNIMESFRYFNRINYLILIPFLSYPITLYISTLRWKTILKSGISLKRLFKINWISSFFSNFLPSTIGGDSYRYLELKDEINKRQLFSSILLDRYYGVLAVILMSVILSFLTYKLTKNTYFLITLLVFLILTFIFYLLIIKLNIKNKFFSIMKKGLTHLDTFIKSLFYSLIFLIFGAFGLWIYFLMFGYNLNFLIVLSFYSIIQLISLIPISINALGLREGSMIYLFALISIPSEVTLGIGIISRLIMLIQTSFGGVMYLIEKY